MVKAREFVISNGGLEPPGCSPASGWPCSASGRGHPAGHAAGDGVAAVVGPLNPYDWGCWARQTAVAMTVVATSRPVRPLPFHVDELRTGVTPPPAKTGFTASAFGVLDRVLKLYHRSPIKPGRKMAFPARGE